jgi:hypothetical protein
MNENRHICRAKRDPDGRWFDGYYVMLQGIDGPLHLIIDRTGQYIRIDPETVGECTGCLDVQGRLIYEGDIICNAKGTTFEVEYNAEDGAFIGQRTKNMTYAYLHEIDKPEIIGNVHEEQMRM